MKSVAFIASGILFGLLSILVSLSLWYSAIQNSSMSRSATTNAADYQRAAEIFAYSGWGVILFGLAGSVGLIVYGIKCRKSH